jgi:23S rRNA (adenine2503-C2)-methyltransferase
MGEPAFNRDVPYVAVAMSQWGGYNVHPVVSTMLPRGLGHVRLLEFLRAWLHIKNDIYDGNAGMQISVNSTNEIERDEMFNGNAISFWDSYLLMNSVLAEAKPKGRKITLNFAVAGYEVDTNLLARYFSPEYYIVKLTPMHKTHTALQNGIKTEGEYTSPEPYEELNERLKKSGFETLVFIASRDEDEGRITCGNAILSGSLPHKFEEE